MSSKPKDLTGMIFGRLTPKEIVRTEPHLGAIWRCDCSCGGSKEVPAARLLKGKTRSCGCMVKEIRERSNIAGQRFGLLVALEYHHTDEKHKPHWLFQCDCGKTKVLPIAAVKWQRVRSCGCLFDQHISNLNRQDIAGERFDRLTAVRPTQKRDGSGSIVWECICDCGKTAYQSVNKLRSGRVHSCGCLYNETRTECIKARRDIKNDTSISLLVSAKRPHVNNTSGFPGVSYDKRRNKWEAKIHFRKVRYYLGSYPTIQEAVAVRTEAEQRIHDTEILNSMGVLTAESKAQFLAYLRGIGMNKDDSHDQPANLQNNATHQSEEDS